MKKTIRSEAAVFAALAALARSPGYIHAVARICYRDNSFAFTANGIEASERQRLYSRNRLIRTEICTILGLLARGPIDTTQPDASTLRRYVDTTDKLMEELHDAIAAIMRDAVFLTKEAESDADAWRGEAMREPIFYGPESAYPFQYRDFAGEKYVADAPWLVQNKGFSIAQAQAIARAMCELLDEKLTQAMNAIRSTGVSPPTWLAAFEQTPGEIAERSRVPVERVRAVLEAFTFRGTNSLFQSVGDFNALNATPLLSTGGDGVILLQKYSLYESLYESPFYWLMSDADYRATAERHRGLFTEAFATRRLTTVFGSKCVFPNVSIVKSKGATVGEIDVLVVYRDRMIIVQAKSKKLTLEARRGNDGQLRKDFAAAIQSSYDQAWMCAQAILAGECALLDAEGTPIPLPTPPKEILIFNVVAEHYPSLAFQARQFLRYRTSDVIRAPFVMDVFLLDALTEMLDTPLRLLSYAKLRVEHTQRLTANHELTALGFHLKRNLWLDKQYDMVVLEDDIAADLDVAMMVRRDGLPGARTPDGILTHLSGSMLERLLLEIEGRSDPVTLEVGLWLLTLGEETCRNIEHGLKLITQQTRLDGAPHDFTIGGNVGIAFHCNTAHSIDAVQRLSDYCQRRKYAQRAGQWFGLSVNPEGHLQFGVSLDSDWFQSKEMDLATAGMRQAIPAARLAELRRAIPRGKVGRNDPCPCGSGKKFKKCCLGR